MSTRIEVGLMMRSEQANVNEAFWTAESLLGAGFDEVKVWIDQGYIIVTKDNIAEQARRYL